MNFMTRFGRDNGLVVRQALATLAYPFYWVGANIVAYVIVACPRRRD